jgi:hypothetical protein
VNGRGQKGGTVALDDHADGHTHATDAWLAAHDFGIHRYALELLHAVITAQCEPLSAARCAFIILNKSRLSECDPITGAGLIQQRLKAKHDGAL